MCILPALHVAYAYPADSVYLLVLVRGGRVERGGRGVHVSSRKGEGVCGEFPLKRAGGSEVCVTHWGWMFHTHCQVGWMLAQLPPSQEASGGGRKCVCVCMCTEPPSLPVMHSLPE